MRLRSYVPFSGVGVDYLRMFTVWIFIIEIKKCLMLYTCASTREVVLDLVHNRTAKTIVKGGWRRYI